MNMRDKCVEAAAVAIVEATSGPFHLLSEEGQRAALLEAEAALAAIIKTLMEPTPKMLWAGENAIIDADGSTEIQSEVFCAMLSSVREGR